MSYESIYDELLQVRQDIRTQLRKARARDITVCSDQALRLMAQQLPRDTEELKNIPGITSLFINNYAPAFLEVIRFNRSQQPMMDMTADIGAEIVHSQAKIIDISSKNPMICIEGTTPRALADLHMLQQGENIVSLLMGQIKELVLCSTMGTLQPAQLAYQTKLYQYYSILAREANREKDKYGKNTLYIGYPIAVGTLPGGTAVRAPLGFFPVVLDIGQQQINLTLDKTRNAQFNASIAAVTVAGMTDDVVLPGKLNLSSYLQELTDWVKRLGLNLQCDIKNGTLIEFQKAMGQSSLPEGQLKAYASAVCGRFPVHESAIHSDCYAIQQNGQITPLLHDLLDPLYEAETKEDEPDIQPVQACALPADYNQRRCVAMAGKIDCILSGPPDSGVMQTVANSILNVVADNPDANIAIVTEMPGALDTLCERMGTAGSYVVRVFDANNKMACAKGIINVAAKNIPVLDPGKEPEELSEAYAVLKDRWETYARGAYHATLHGAYARELYEKGIEWGAYTPDIIVNSKNILKLIDPSLTRISLDRLISVSEKYSNPAAVKSAERVWMLQRRVPMLRYIQRTLSDEAIRELAGLTEKAIKEQRKYDARSAFVKRIIANPSAAIAKAIADRFFEMDKVDQWPIILETPENELNVLLKRYRDHRTAVERMGHTSPLEWDYYTNMERLVEARIVSSIPRANQLLRQIILFDFIAEHERTCGEKWLTLPMLERLQKEMSDNVMNQHTALMNKAVYSLERRRVIHVTSPSGTALYKSVRDISRGNSNQELPVRRIMQGLGLWAMTPESVSSIMPLENGIFDLVVYLSAGQIRPERAIPSLYRARHILVAGDTYQGLTGPAPEGTASLLDVAVKRLPEVKLRCYYGSGHSDAVRYASERFYNNSISIIDDAKLPIASGIEWIHVPEAEWVNNCNDKEARVVVDTLVSQLEKDPNCDIAILSFSTRQRERIALLLAERSEKDAKFNALLQNRTRKIFVSDVNDAYYESHDIVITSVGITPAMSTNIDEVTGWPAFFTDSALCTVCTRAREKLILVSSVSSSDIVALSGPGEVLSGLWGLLSFVKQPSRSGVTISATPAIEAIRREISAVLSKQGYSCKYNVGCGEHAVDIAVIKDDLYCLGIILDNTAPADAESTVNQHLDRLQYLTARGWKLHQLRLQDWCKEKYYVLARIIEDLAS